MSGSLLLTVADRTGELQEREAYEVANLFLQQLALAANLVLPGSIQILAARYDGPGAHLVEAGVADSVISGAARLVLQGAASLPALDCHGRNAAALLRKRLRMLLPDLPESLDCIRDLFSVRAELLQGFQPVQRPPLLAHDMQDELQEQLGQHNLTAINAAALVHALLAQLVARGCSDFVFSESVALR